MRQRLVPATFVLAAVLAGSLADAGGEKKPVKMVKPVRSWTGRVEDAAKGAALRKEAPTTGYVSDPKAWEKLWRAWRGEEKAPVIDFRKEVVFIHTVTGPNAVKTTYTVNDQGDLTPRAEATLIAGPGFSYVLDVLSRADFKTSRGKALDRPE